VLQHFSKDDARRALGEVRRVLSPGGQSLIQMPNALGVRSAYHLARRGFRQPQGFDVRYWTLSELRSAFESLLGPSSLSVDGFFGLGIQPSDAPFLPLKHRLVVQTSELLRHLSRLVPPLTFLADSVYVQSRRV
jgi:hypothetical protein